VEKHEGPEVKHGNVQGAGLEGKFNVKLQKSFGGGNSGELG
jgi:hypothetical protein